MESRAFALVVVVGILASVGAQAPAPGPAETCTTTSLVGPGQYAVQGTVDALEQTPRSVFVCPSGGLFGIDTQHIAASNSTFPGPAASSNVNWNAGQLIFYCTQDNYQVATGPLPMPYGAESVRGVDVDSYNGYTQGNSRPPSPETLYRVTPTTSLFLHNILPLKRAAPSSPYFIPDATYTNVTCADNHKFVGARWASSYGGIDDLELICAPNCWEPPFDSTVNVAGDTVVAGRIYTQSQVAVRTPPVAAGTCSNANPGSQAHIGPGTTFEGLRKNFTGTNIVKQPVTTLLCPGNSYITQWNLRGQQWPRSYTGERVAYIGAACSDGSKLAPAPVGNLSGTANGPLGPDVYFTAGGLSGTNDMNGWNSFFVGIDGPDNPLGFPVFLGTLGAASSQTGDFGQSTEQVSRCPLGERAVGYTIGAYSGGGITFLDLVCTPNCTLSGMASAPAPGRMMGGGATPSTPAAMGPGVHAPSGAPGGQAQPTPNPPSEDDSPGKSAYGCGSTIQAGIGPGAYALYKSGLALPLQQQQYSTHVCPPGAFIETFRASVSSFDSKTKSEYDTYVTSISATCARRTPNAPRYELTAVEAPLATNETEYTFTEPAGFSVFEISPHTEQQLQQFIDIDDTPATNYTLSCPVGFVAIGYEGAAYAYGIDYLNIICGPVLPEDCPDNGQGGGAIPWGNHGGGSAGSGGTIAPPTFPYTTSPNGPSWGVDSFPPRPSSPTSSAAPPPPPNSPGNPIDLSKLTAKQTYLRVGLGVTGNDIFPFSKTLQDDYNRTLATICKVPGRNVTYVSATLNTTATSGRRHLLTEQAGRSLLAVQTVDVVYSINFASARALAEAAEQLTESLTPPNTTFKTVLKHDELSTSLLSLNATDQQASTQAQSSNCPRKFGSICTNSRISNGGIIGIIIGGIVFLALVAALAFFLLSRRRRAARSNVH